jgi:hypothetical protein
MHAVRLLADRAGDRPRRDQSKRGGCSLPMTAPETFPAIAIALDIGSPPFNC